MSKLLLVEDNLELAQRLQEHLESEKYSVAAVHSGHDALQILKNFHFDIIVLDWDLPDITGLDVCKQYRKTGGTAPILFLTGHAAIDDKESGLDSGGDDYMVKPFLERELFARLRTLMRRPFDLQKENLEVSGASLNVGNRILMAGQAEIRLTPREAAVLEVLMRHPNRIFSAKALLDAAWPVSTDSFEESVRTCLKTLRHKLAKIDRGNFIKTVLGAGYVIESTDKP